MKVIRINEIEEHLLNIMYDKYIEYLEATEENIKTAIDNSFDTNISEGLVNSLKINNDTKEILKTLWEKIERGDV